MELIFTKEHGIYVAQFRATGDFNIHLERNDGGILNILQSTIADGEYDIVSSHKNIQDRVFDCDFTAMVYPKYIKIVSNTEVTRCIITM
jgi:hypothetical protein